MLQTTLRTGYITDLILPAPHDGETSDDVLRVGLDAIFSSVHTPNTMITLNPLVHDVKQLQDTDPKAVDVRTLAPSFGVALDAPYVVNAEAGTDARAEGVLPDAAGFKHFAILDKLNMLFGYTTDLLYHTAIRQTKSGMEAFTNAGSGVVICGKWDVKVSESSTSPQAAGLAGPGKVINLIERNEIRCNLVLSWYIKSSLDKSHRETHRRLKEKWIKAMKDAGYEYPVQV